MEITIEKLRELKACYDAIVFVETEYPDGFELDEEFIAKHQDKYRWLFWMLPRLMTRKQCVAFAVYAAELVLPIWQIKYPDDNRPEEAIEAAKKWMENPTAANAAAAANAATAANAADDAHTAYASAAASVASAAAYASYAASAAVSAAYDAAASAAYAASAAVNAAYTAANAAANAAADVTSAAYAASAAATLKILLYGVKLIKEEEDENND